LSSIVSLYPDAAPITEVKQAEQQKLLRDVESLNLSASLLNDPSNKNMAFYLKSRTELFTIKQEILQSL